MEAAKQNQSAKQEPLNPNDLMDDLAKMARHRSVQRAEHAVDGMGMLGSGDHKRRPS